MGSLARAFRIHAITGDEVLAVWEDELDVEYVGEKTSNGGAVGAVWELEWPERRRPACAVANDFRATPFRANARVTPSAPRPTGLSPPR